MKRILIIISAVFVFSPLIMGQQRTAAISFNETTWNYGDIREETGVATHRFEFTNTGGEPLIIHNVTASCGCTSPSWTREPVMPGSKGYVSAAYDPAGRPGRFDKTVNVMTNAAPGNIVLRIAGNVIPKPLTIEDEYRYPMGPIRLKSNHVSLGTVYSGQQQTALGEIINTSDQPVTVEIRNVPAHIKVNVNSAKLAPKQKGVIEVTYDATKIDDWGFLIDRMNVYVNGQTDRTYQFIISANIEESFANLTEQQLSSAPSIVFEETTFNIGKLEKGRTVEYEYVFRNEGKSDLIIRKIAAACGCTATMLSSKVIPSGQSGKIKTTFNSAGQRGTQTKTITVISNDPKNPKTVLWIRGEVAE